MSDVTQHKPGLLAVRLDEFFCWRAHCSDTWRVEDLSGVVFIVPDRGLPPDEVVAALRYRLFEQHLHLYGVREYEWIKGASMVG